MCAMSTVIQIPIPSATWAPCPTCWGQRRIFEDRNGEGLVPCTCSACLGLGERIVLKEFTVAGAAAALVEPL
jgi:hypothetical protein